MDAMFSRSKITEFAASTLLPFAVSGGGDVRAVVFDSVGVGVGVFIITASLARRFGCSGEPDRRGCQIDARSLSSLAWMAPDARQDSALWPMSIRFIPAPRRGIREAIQSPGRVDLARRSERPGDGSGPRAPA